MAHRNPQDAHSDSADLSALFPSEMRALLVANGRQLVERLGPEIIRNATLQILLGHNVRTQTEPLTRQRIAEISGAMIALFDRGQRTHSDFYSVLSDLAVKQMRGGSPSDRAGASSAQWVLGLTKKGVQNVLRNNPGVLASYLSAFEGALGNAAKNLEAKLGPMRMTFGVGRDSGLGGIVLGWREALRITTVLGCAELAIRGSEKSRYGKLFERLVLGSVLQILGFGLVERNANCNREHVFWLSDSRDERECDATAIIRPGTVARFDIGFIGIGNPEVARDKLSRFARETEHDGVRHGSTTFIIVDRYPTGPHATSRQLADKTGAALIEMSMSLWPRELAKELAKRVRYRHKLAGMPDPQAEAYIRSTMQNVDVSLLLRGRVETTD